MAVDWRLLVCELSNRRQDIEMNDLYFLLKAERVARPHELRRPSVERTTLNSLPERTPRR